MNLFKPCVIRHHLLIFNFSPLKLSKLTNHTFKKVLKTERISEAEINIDIWNENRNVTICYVSQQWNSLLPLYLTNGVYISFLRIRLDPMCSFHNIGHRCESWRYNSFDTADISYSIMKNNHRTNWLKSWNFWRDIPGIH